ncbi:hypothetical protein [Parasphingorhabdus sp.]|uniref:hypothetical protein n=1 Tax=Parasphingorhabdus sp. TaxID=2709688 RepID=UPI00359328B6
MRVGIAALNHMLFHSGRNRHLLSILLLRFHNRIVNHVVTLHFNDDPLAIIALKEEIGIVASKRPNATFGTDRFNVCFALSCGRFILDPIKPKALDSVARPAIGRTRNRPYSRCHADRLDHAMNQSGRWG